MDYKATVISVIVSVVIAAITGWITAKQSYNREIKKDIYGERQKLYIEIFELLENIERSPYLIYTDAFVQKIQSISAKTKLYASGKVLKIIEPFIKTVIKSWQDYMKLYKSEQALQELQNRQYAAELDGDFSLDQIEIEFEQEAETYMDTHLISDENTRSIMHDLATQIRAELKTK